MSYLTSGEVRRRTGASARMLDHWHWSGLIVPGHEVEPRRLYTDHDAIKIRALLALRSQGVALGTIRKCLRVLDERRDDLQQVRLIVIGKDVYTAASERDVERISDGQLAMTMLSCDALGAAPVAADAARESEPEERDGR